MTHPALEYMASKSLAKKKMRKARSLQRNLRPVANDVKLGARLLNSAKGAVSLRVVINGKESGALPSDKKRVRSTWENRGENTGTFWKQSEFNKCKNM